jgi:hypothetical protein
MKYVGLTICIILLSCKKFEHKEFKISECVLCEYADSVEGVYRGYFKNGLASYLNDSANVVVEHFYPQSSVIEDSSIMYFKLTMTKDQTPDSPISYYVRVDNPEGNVMDYNKSDWYTYSYSGAWEFIRKDSLQLRSDFEPNPSSNAVICVSCGVFYPQ